MQAPLPLLLIAPTLAQAGGGSSGFSGGGGGGGGGGFSGGGSSGSGSAPPGLIIGIIVVVVAIIVIQRMATAASRAQRAQERRQREERARAAAVEAAEDDEAFELDALLRDASQLFVDVQAAWDQRDREALDRLLGPDLLTEWKLRLDDFDRKRWHSRVTTSGRPEVQLVGVVNRAEDADDRVVVFVADDIEAWVVDAGGKHRYRDGKTGPALRLEQYWTLGKRGDDWILLSIEEEAEGRHHLDGALVATPAADPALERRVRTEIAVADATTPAEEVATLTTITDDARAAALDLSLVDDRFSPDVLTAAVRDAVDAWVEAIDGDDAALERRADEAAIQALLYGDDRARRVRTVVRGLHVHAVLIDALDGRAAPPTMRVTVRYEGAWYREDRDTQAVVDGSRSRRVLREEQWTLALVDDAEVPWRLVRAA